MTPSPALTELATVYLAATETPFVRLLANALADDALTPLAREKARRAVLASLEARLSILTRALEGATP